MAIEKRIKEAELETDLNPTESQKESGNYQKGEVSILGFSITIENPKNSIRSGVDENGKKWEIKMNNSYGYFNNTLGVDGDEIDLFLGGSYEKDFKAFIIEQVNQKTMEFDEHKIMFGFHSEKFAKEEYLKNFEKGWQGLGNIKEVNIEELKEFLYKNESITNKKQMNDEIKIVKLEGEVISGETLKSLKEQAGDLSNIKILTVDIASHGGSVSEGLETIMWFEELSKMGIKVCTVVSANAYSIASLIAIAADARAISKHGKIMVHNPMVAELQYVNANDLEMYVNELRSLEKMMYDLYCGFTGMDEKTIKLMMNKETFLSPSESVDFGFSDIEVDMKKREYSKAINNKKEVNMKNVKNTLLKAIAMMNQSEFISQFYYDEKGGEIEINQKDPAMYSKGDRTSVKEGVVTIGSNGTQLEIVDFVIENIKREVAVEAAAKPFEKKDDKAPIVPEEVEEMETEEEIEAKKKAKMDAKAVEVEAKVEVPTVETPDFKAILDEAMAKLSEDIDKKIDSKLETINKSIEESSKDFEAFQTLATEAIDVIATSTSSGFSPVAKTKAEATENFEGTIWEKIQAAKAIKK